MRAAIAILVALAIGFAVYFYFSLDQSMRVATPDVAAPDSQAPDSLTLAWKRVSATPRDARAWIALGDAQAELGELDAAEQSYRTALRIEPNNATSLAQLGFLLYERGQEQEALAALTEAKLRGSDAPLLVSTIQALHDRLGAKAPEVVAQEHIEQPPPPPPDRVCDVPLIAGGKSAVVELEMNHQPLRLVFDTGATMTLVCQDAANRLALESGEHRIHAGTANGKTEFASGFASNITLGGRELGRTLVAISDKCDGTMSEGLLGLDLISALGLQLDLKSAKIHFADCN